MFIMNTTSKTSLTGSCETEGKVFYEIYIDSIFLINFILNLFLLTLTARTLNRTATRFRLIGGSAAGALGYCIILWLPLPYSGKILIGLIPVSIGMCGITFRSRGYRNVLRETGYLFVYAFLLGGAMVFLLNRFTFLGRAGGKAAGIMGVGYVCFALTDFFLRKHRERKADPFCRVVIPCGEEEVCVNALIDTGNGLREPVTGKPVSILEEAVWERLGALMREEKLKLIPYHSVGNSHGLMKGYELASVIIVKEEQRICCEKVVVGICEGEISSGKQYQMILHPDLV